MISLSIVCLLKFSNSYFLHNLILIYIYIFHFFFDFKPENVLVIDKSGNRIKLIDFGLARRIEKGKKLQVLFGTVEFVSFHYISLHS